MRREPNAWAGSFTEWWRLLKKSLSASHGLRMVAERVQTLDVIMLYVTGGRERTARQLREFVEGSGFRYATGIETAGPLRIVEATAAEKRGRIIRSSGKPG